MKASVAYESRKPRELRWHKIAGGGLGADGNVRWTIARADRVNRAKGIFKWILARHGVQGPSGPFVVAKSSDNIAELKAFASVEDRQPNPPSDAREGREHHDTMIPPPVPTMPASVTRGPPVGMHYASSVQEKLERMGSPTPLEDVRKSSAYLADCERGGISPEVAAAVVLGTLHHGHQHTGGKVTEFALEHRLTPSERHDMPRREFAIPELEALPLDTVKRIRNAPARLEMMHNAGTISEAQYRRAEHRIAAASKAHGIHSMYANEAPTGSEWEVVVSNPPAAHRGHILSLTDPGEGFEAGDKIYLWGFYDDTEASHVATAIARRYRVPVTFGPKRAVEREEGSHGRPFAREARGDRSAEPPKACGCKPFTVVSKDPELYAKCKKRADAIGPLTNPRAIYDYLSSDMSLLSHEEFRVLGIGSRGELEGKLITDARVAHGDQHEVKVYIEQISQVLLADRPDIYIIAHNHPGGDATPSEEDERLTGSIVEGLKSTCPHIVFGDHLVIASREFYSFREKKKHRVR